MQYKFRRQVVSAVTSFPIESCHTTSAVLSCAVRSSEYERSKVDEAGFTVKSVACMVA